VLAAYLIRALSGRVPEWRMFEYLDTRGDQPDVPDVLTRLPIA